MIAVIGASGHTGKIASERLLDAGEAVRAIARSADRLQPLVARGAEAAVGDAADPAFLATAFRGADAVYAMVPPDMQTTDPLGRAERWGQALARAVRDAGVGHVVLLSSLGAEHASGTGPIAGLHRVEETLKQLPGVSFVSLRPGYFYENIMANLPLITHQGINGGVIAPTVPFTMTATQDIGVFAADALRQKATSASASASGSANFTVREILGPRDLTQAEATRIVGEKIGRPDLPYIQFADEDLVKGLVGAGISEQLSRLYVEMSHAISDGLVRPHEQRHAGNTGSTTFETFAETVAAAYRAL